MSPVYDDYEAIRFIAGSSGLEVSVVSEVHRWFDLYMVEAGIYPVGVLGPHPGIEPLPAGDRLEFVMPRRRSTTWDAELLYLKGKGVSEDVAVAVLEGITAYQVRIGIVEPGVLEGFQAWKAYR